LEFALTQPGCQFASDNTSGLCPEGWEAMRQANEGFVPSYGNDAWTARASDLLREWFETDCEVFFTFNGTAANSLALAAMCQSYHSVICADVAHVETDECGAPEFFSNGSKLLVAPSVEGKVRPESVEAIVTRRTDIHYPKPRVLSLTQATECGTVYSLAELEALTQAARRHGLHVHLDGARFFNALHTLGATPRQASWQAGVDVLCLGGTKIGLGVGDVVVFFNKTLAEEFAYRCKQAGQLASKMRYLSAPWVGLLEQGAWRTHAGHANACAQQLAAGLERLGLSLMFPRQANGVFVKLDTATAEKLRRRGWAFYTFIGHGGARFMCSWATTDEDVRAILADLADVLIS
jgi:threonine aldolase